MTYKLNWLQKSLFLLIVITLFFCIAIFKQNNRIEKLLTNQSMQLKKIENIDYVFIRKMIQEEIDTNPENYSYNKNNNNNYDHIKEEDLKYFILLEKMNQYTENVESGIIEPNYSMDQKLSEFKELKHRYPEQSELNIIKAITIN